jgi:hypothetical protein
MIGPLPTAPGGFNGVLVAIDKFTKWIKVKLVTCPKADRVLDFLDELVHRYGLPHRIVIDLNSDSSDYSRVVSARLRLQMEKLSEQDPMGFYPHEGFAEVNKDGDVKNAIRVQVQVLNTLVLEQTLEEI